ncbi:MULTISPECIES: NAD(P)/FAD-dependent oxidoreductase [unclassified Streptomyces]|uniref:NAD(P)/FAD-dependent oxidoreductase n=1 Tax=unclassified Streptomyces TaxID=2593676 RepID=UPI0037F5201F
MSVGSPGGAPDRIVVVGAGVAGIAAVEQLRSLGHSGKITLIDAGEQPYDRPPLSKAFLLGEADVEQIRLVSEAWFDDNDVELRARRSAVRLRPAEGSVELDDGSHAPADAVLLANGGIARRLPVPGGDLPGVRVLRTVDDARALREALVPGARTVVIGGGLIGAEVASSAVALGCEVTLVEPVVPPLAPAVGTEIATLLHRQHTQVGIRLVTDTVARIKDGPGHLLVVTGAGQEYAADVVVTGIGMTVPGDLARSAGLDTSDGVIVDRFHRTSHPAVFAAGDTARIRRPDGTLHRREHWQAARQDGRTAAAAMLGQPLPATDPDWFWSDRHGVHVEGVGDLRTGGRRVLRGAPDSLPLAVFDLADDGRLLGAAAVDDPRAIAAARRLISAGAVPDPDLLADTSVNPRAWLRR